MDSVVGIRFSPCGKIYCFKADGLELKRGERVVVESDLGVSIACGVHFRSSANHIEFMHLRDAVLSGRKSFAGARKRFLEIIDDEYEAVRTLLPIAESTITT